jgi:hypothetical protein
MTLNGIQQLCPKLSKFWTVGHRSNVLALNDWSAGSSRSLSVN